MKLVSYLDKDSDKLGIYANGLIYPMNELDSSLPDNMLDFLLEGEEVMKKAKKLDEKIRGNKPAADGIPYENQELLAPIPYPTSCRDAYAFRQHVATARRNRGVEMIPEFDQFPIFYFTNHLAIQGPGDLEFMPDHFDRLDYELEIAIVTGKEGRNIRAKEADDYIAGYMIMNDFSARRLQMEEMKLNLGPAKGKDFATAIGPWLVTPDELEPYKTNTKSGHTGNSFNLEMIARINGKEYSRGNFGDMDWTFAEILERVSYGVDIFPGEVIGSGTVGTGCLLELNGTRKLKNPDFEPEWLKDGDEIELEITGLGVLSNTIYKENTDYSLLALKKNV